MNSRERVLRTFGKLPGRADRSDERNQERYPGDQQLAARIASYELAARMQLSAPEVTNLNAESATTHKLYGTSDSNYMELRGCRRQLPENFTGMMKEVASRRCLSCHKNSDKDDNWVFKQKDNFYIRIDNPRWNNFLMAPLAKKSGES